MFTTKASLTNQVTQKLQNKLPMKIVVINSILQYGRVNSKKGKDQRKMVEVICFKILAKRESAMFTSKVSLTYWVK